VKPHGPSGFIYISFAAFLVFFVRFMQVVNSSKAIALITSNRPNPRNFDQIFNQILGSKNSPAFPLAVVTPKI